MFVLTLAEVTDTGDRLIGRVRITENRIDPNLGVGSFIVEREDGQQIASIENWDLRIPPWKLAQLTLNKIYPGFISFDNKLRDDGQCNAVSTKGKRCKLEAQDSKFYCSVHDPMQRI